MEKKVNPRLVLRLSTGSFRVSRTDTGAELLTVTASCEEEACFRAWAVRSQFTGLPDEPELLSATECDDVEIYAAATSIVYYVVIDDNAEGTPIEKLH